MSTGDHTAMGSDRVRTAWLAASITRPLGTEAANDFTVAFDAVAETVAATFSADRVERPLFFNPLPAQSMFAFYNSVTGTGAGDNAPTTQSATMSASSPLHVGGSFSGSQVQNLGLQSPQPPKDNATPTSSTTPVDSFGKPNFAAALSSSSGGGGGEGGGGGGGGGGVHAHEMVSPQLSSGPLTSSMRTAGAPHGAVASSDSFATLHMVKSFLRPTPPHSSSRRTSTKDAGKDDEIAPGSKKAKSVSFLPRFLRGRAPRSSVMSPEAAPGPTFPHTQRKDDEQSIPTTAGSSSMDVDSSSPLRKSPTTQEQQQHREGPSAATEAPQESEPPTQPPVTSAHAVMSSDAPSLTACTAPDGHPIESRPPIGSTQGSTQPTMAGQDLQAQDTEPQIPPAAGPLDVKSPDDSPNDALKSQSTLPFIPPPLRPAALIDADGASGEVHVVFPRESSPPSFDSSLTASRGPQFASSYLDDDPGTPPPLRSPAPTPVHGPLRLDDAATAIVSEFPPLSAHDAGDHLPPGGHSVDFSLPLTRQLSANSFAAAPPLDVTTNRSAPAEKRASTYEDDDDDAVDLPRVLVTCDDDDDAPGRRRLDERGHVHHPHHDEASNDFLSPNPLPRSMWPQPSPLAFPARTPPVDVRTLEMPPAAVPSDFTTRDSHLSVEERDLTGQGDELARRLQTHDGDCLTELSREPSAVLEFSSPPRNGSSTARPSESPEHAHSSPKNPSSFRGFTQNAHRRFHERHEHALSQARRQHRVSLIQGHLRCIAVMAERCAATLAALASLYQEVKAAAAGWSWAADNETLYFIAATLSSAAEKAPSTSAHSPASSSSMQQQAGGSRGGDMFPDASPDSPRRHRSATESPSLSSPKDASQQRPTNAAFAHQTATMKTADDDGGQTPQDARPFATPLETRSARFKRRLSAVFHSMSYAASHNPVFNFFSSGGLRAFFPVQLWSKCWPLLASRENRTTALDSNHRRIGRARQWCRDIEQRLAASIGKSHAALAECSEALHALLQVIELPDGSEERAIVIEQWLEDIVCRLTTRLEDISGATPAGGDVAVARQRRAAAAEADRARFEATMSELLQAHREREQQRGTSAENKPSGIRTAVGGVVAVDSAPGSPQKTSTAPNHAPNNGTSKSARRKAKTATAAADPAAFVAREERTFELAALQRSFTDAERYFSNRTVSAVAAISGHLSTLRQPLRTPGHAFAPAPYRRTLQLAAVSSVLLTFSVFAWAFRPGWSYFAWFRPALDAYVIAPSKGIVTGVFNVPERQRTAPEISEEDALLEMVLEYHVDTGRGLPTSVSRNERYERERVNAMVGRLMSSGIANGGSSGGADGLPEKKPSIFSLSRHLGPDGTLKSPAWLSSLLGGDKPAPFSLPPSLQLFSGDRSSLHAAVTADDFAAVVAPPREVQGGLSLSDRLPARHPAASNNGTVTSASGRGAGSDPSVGPPSSSVVSSDASMFEYLGLTEGSMQTAMRMTGTDHLKAALYDLTPAWFLDGFDACANVATAVSGRYVPYSDLPPYPLRQQFVEKVRDGGDMAAVDLVLSLPAAAFAHLKPSQPSTPTPTTSSSGSSAPTAPRVAPLIKNETQSGAVLRSDSVRPINVYRHGDASSSTEKALLESARPDDRRLGSAGRAHGFLSDRLELVGSLNVGAFSPVPVPCETPQTTSGSAGGSSTSASNSGAAYTQQLLQHSGGFALPSLDSFFQSELDAPPHHSSTPMVRSTENPTGKTTPDSGRMRAWPFFTGALRGMSRDETADASLSFAGDLGPIDRLSTPHRTSFDHSSPPPVRAPWFSRHDPSRSTNQLPAEGTTANAHGPALTLWERSVAFGKSCVPSISSPVASPFKIVRDFYFRASNGYWRHDHAVEDARQFALRKIEEAVRGGDLGVVQTDYIAALRRPLSAVLYGHLVRLFFIQVQKQKADVDHVMSASSEVLEQNDITYRLFALLPFGLSVAAAVSLLVRRRRRYHGPLQADMRRCWRSLHRQLCRPAAARPDPHARGQQVHPRPHHPSQAPHSPQPPLPQRQPLQCIPSASPMHSKSAASNSESGGGAVPKFVPGSPQLSGGAGGVSGGGSGGVDRRHGAVSPQPGPESSVATCGVAARGTNSPAPPGAPGSSSGVGGSGELLSHVEHGNVLLRAYELRVLAGVRWAAGSEALTEFLEDVDDIEARPATRRQRLQAMERMAMSFAFLSGATSHDG